jgi:hypothetical protein
MSPTPSAQDFPLDRAGLCFLEPVALDAKAVDGIEHSLKQGFGRCRRYHGPLELPDLSALTVDLNAQAFDVSPNMFDIRHIAPREVRLHKRTK